VPDVFQPAEVQIGFLSSPPSKPVSPVSLISPTVAAPTVAIRQRDPNARYLDRNETVWGKWYAKTTKPEDLPFAKGHKEGTTEQQVWNQHAAEHEPWRENPDVERSQVKEDEEQERAARLRYHSGHCYGALTGDVYPFQGGLII
jgi:hypothetical protein